MDRASIGIVIIGRNEGERLTRCLRSVLAAGAPIIYVDSGSTDGSAQRARDLGAEVVELDARQPFTAARGRNEGFARLLTLHPELFAVQFLDGDTEVLAGWLEAAAAALAHDPGLAAVCGRRRERRPDASVYNLLCDIEWRTPVGDAPVFGGDVMIRADDLRRSGGYDATLIAGEDPDLAVRLRLAGRRILRLDRDMTLHDAAMTRFTQWWTRTVRAGWAFADGAARFGGSPVHHWRHEARSNWAWGAAVPVLGAAFAVPTLGASVWASAAGYAVLFARVQRKAARAGLTRREASIYAAFTVLAKVPQALGQAGYWTRRALRRPSGLMEYK